MSEKPNNNHETFKVTGDWAAQAKALKSKYSLLTDLDLHLEPGKDAEMLNRLQHRLSKSREETIGIIRNIGKQTPEMPPPSKL
jgi:hypothetical protein